MVFIRVKNRVFEGNEFDYAYLVENKRGRYGTRQKVLEYLGRIYKFEKVRDVELKVKEGSYKNLLISLYIHELRECGFRNRQGIFVKGKCSVDLENLKVFGENSKVVLQMNAGFICDYSINGLVNLKILDDEKSRRLFAKKLLLGGLDIKPEVFVELYKRLLSSD